jgi:hypothetical protein
MSINSISAAGLSQGVLASSNSAQQQALQSLQQSRASGAVNGAQSAFQTLEALFQTPRPLPEARYRTILSSRPICQPSEAH